MNKLSKTLGVVFLAGATLLGAQNTHAQELESIITSSNVPAIQQVFSHETNDNKYTMVLPGVKSSEWSGFVYNDAYTWGDFNKSIDVVAYNQLGEQVSNSSLAINEEGKLITVLNDGVPGDLTYVFHSSSKLDPNRLFALVGEAGEDLKTVDLSNLSQSASLPHLPGEGWDVELIIFNGGDSEDNFPVYLKDNSGVDIASEIFTIGPNQTRTIYLSDFPISDFNGGSALVCGGFNNYIAASVRMSQQGNSGVEELISGKKLFSDLSFNDSNGYFVTQTTPEGEIQRVYSANGIDEFEKIFFNGGEFSFDGVKTPQYLKGQVFNSVTGLSSSLEVYNSPISTLDRVETSSATFNLEDILKKQGDTSMFLDEIGYSLAGSDGRVLEEGNDISKEDIVLDEGDNEFRLRIFVKDSNGKYAGMLDHDITITYTPEGGSGGGGTSCWGGV